MVLIVCIDDRLGLSFNNRRLSSDKTVIEDLLQTVGNEKIQISPYSLSLFKGHEDRICSSDSFLDRKNSICFAEFGDFNAIVDDVETLIVYKWNRHYPSDRKFPLGLFTSKLTKKSIREFPGSSHPCITREEFTL